MRSVAFLVVSFGLVSCGPPREKVQACEAALNARLAAIQAAAAAVDSAESEGAARIAAAEQSAKAADKRLAKVTIPYKDVLSYPDRLKERIAAGKMRFVSATPLRAEGGSPLKALRYDVELTGDYRAVAKTLRALYEQPVALFVDRVEVNVTDEYRKQATVRMQVFVHEMPKPIQSVPPGKGPSPAWSAAIAKVTPDECAGISSRLASEIETARAALEARGEAAEKARVVEDRENLAKARAALADELLAKRDDNKAAFTSRADELVEKAKTSVAGLAELRFTASGEPDWR